MGYTLKIKKEGENRGFHPARGLLTGGEGIAFGVRIEFGIGGAWRGFR